MRADLSTVRRALTALALLCVLAAPAGAATHRIAAISISPASLAGGTTGSAYSQTLTGSGGTGPYTFAVTAGSLPPGLSLAAGGTLSGTPTSVGSYSFTVTATDSLNATGSQAFSVTVSPAVVDIQPGSLSPASRGVFYAALLTASGGTAPYTFAVTSGSLPAGLSLAATGQLSGTPGATGSYTFTATATDAHGASNSRTFVLNVNVSTLDISPSLLADAAAGSAYTVSLVGNGGTAPYTFALANGTTLPPGLALASNGALTGVPSQVGSYTVTVRVTDATSQVATRAYTLRVAVNPLLVTASFPSASYAKSFDAQFSASGGASPYTFTVSGGALPNGLALSSNGDLAGTPTQSGTFNFSVTATDTYGDTGTFPFTLVVAPATIALAPPTLFPATPGVFYSSVLTASGGVGTYTFSLVSGNLPRGLTLAADGTLIGTVDDVVGLYTFTVQAVDANGQVGSMKLLLKVAMPMILVTTLGLPNGTVNTAYSFQLAATGGTSPYTYTLADGTLPKGMQLSASGVLSGTPSAAGASLFTVSVVDAHGVSVTQSFRLVVDKATAPVKTKPKKKKTVKKTRH
jgi:large repetitive protein